MKVIDLSAKNQAGRTEGLLDRALGVRRLAGTPQDARAQEAVIAALQKVLDSDFVLLRNVPLQGLEIPIPIVLIGPPGVWVIYASPLRGIFRARDETWEKLDDDSQRFRAVQPNLLTRARLMAQAMNKPLTEGSFPLLQPEPALVFTDPGTHVDSQRPVARIVLADALERFGSGLLQSRMVLDKESVQRLALILGAGGSEPEEALRFGDAPDAFSFRDIPEEMPIQPKPVLVLDRSEAPILKKVPFTGRQWALIGLMVLVNILLLTAFMVIILILT